MNPFKLRYDRIAGEYEIHSDDHRKILRTALLIGIAGARSCHALLTALHARPRLYSVENCRRPTGGDRLWRRVVVEWGTDTGAARSGGDRG